MGLSKWHVQISSCPYRSWSKESKVKGKGLALVRYVPAAKSHNDGESDQIMASMIYSTRASRGDEKIEEIDS